MSIHLTDTDTFDENYLPQNLHNAVFRALRKEHFKSSHHGSIDNWSDKDDVHNQLFALALSCHHTTDSNSEAIRHFATAKRRVNYERRETRISDNPFNISDHHQKRIRAIYAQAQHAYPDNEEMQQKARQHFLAKEPKKTREAWDAWHVDLLELDKEVVTEDGDVTSVVEMLPLQQLDLSGSQEAEALNLINHAIDEAGLGEVHKLIAFYLTESPEPSVREITRRLQEENGHMREKSAVGEYIKQTKAACESWILAMRKKEKER